MLVVAVGKIMAELMAQAALVVAEQVEPLTMEHPIQAAAVALLQPAALVAWAMS
jgi:hypothetical protein